MFRETFPELSDASNFFLTRVLLILDHTEILQLLEEQYRFDLLADGFEIIDPRLEYIRTIYKNYIKCT